MSECQSERESERERGSEREREGAREREREREIFSSLKAPTNNKRAESWPAVVRFRWMF